MYEFRISKLCMMLCFALMLKRQQIGRIHSHKILVELWSELMQCEQSLMASVLHKTTVRIPL